MATFDLKEYARRGAEARIAELHAELEAIFRVFPDMRPGRRAGSAAPGRTRAAITGRRRRRGMSAAQRRAVSRRMKKYWAGRRKARIRDQKS